MSSSDSYGNAVKYVQETLVNYNKKKGHKAKRRDFKGRVLPKASINKLAKKANIVRLAYGPSKDGYAEDPEKDTYGYIDRKVFDLMENVLYDAITISDASRKGKKGQKRIVQKKHMLTAIKRYGMIGLGDRKTVV